MNQTFELAQPQGGLFLDDMSDLVGLQSSDVIEWCIESHVAFQFQAVKLVGIALLLLIFYNFIADRYEYIKQTTPKQLMYAVDIYIRHAVSASVYLIIAFLIWNLHTSGFIHLPFLELEFYNR